jgi:hypothetical protein
LGFCSSFLKRVFDLRCCRHHHLAAVAQRFVHLSAHPHRFEEPETKDNDYEVVWWDPRALGLNIPPSFGIRQEELLKESNDPKILKNDLESYESWRTRWDTVRQRAAQPSVIFRTATAQARNESNVLEIYRDVQVIELPRDPERPAGARFGALVHATLA